MERDRNSEAIREACEEEMEPSRQRAVVMRRGALLAVLIGFSVLAGCGQKAAPTDFVSDVDDDTIAAIAIARHVPAVARYIRLPKLDDAPGWHVHSDIVGYSSDDQRSSDFQFRTTFCPNQYVVEPVITPKDEKDDELDPPELMVDVRTRRVRLMKMDDGFVEPDPQPTPCLDGSKPKVNRYVAENESQPHG